MKIKAMTFNIHHGKGMDKLTNLYRIANVIDKCGADFIALNEVDSHFSKRSFFKDQAGWLAKELSMDYAFSQSIFKKEKNLLEPRQYGNAFLSRHPISAKESHLFKISRLTEGRSLLEANVQFQKRSLKIAVTHLSLNPILHRKQTDFIIERFQKSTDPTILMGDWNMKPGSKGWGKITKEFQDVWEAAGKGSGYTYPSFRPRSRLDYIFASRDFEIIHAEVVNKVSEASVIYP